MASAGNDRVHVLTLIDSIRLGGAEQLALELALRAEPTRFRRTVCATRELYIPMMQAYATRRLEELDAAGVDVVALERSSRYDLRPWTQLARLLRAERVDVIHAHGFGSNLWGTILGRLARVPVVLAHEHTWSFQGEPVRRALDREVIGRFADAILAVSEADARKMVDIVGIKPERIVFVPNGIPPMPAGDGAPIRREAGVPLDAPVLVAVANLRPQKALDVMIRAFTLVRAEVPAARLLIAGAANPLPLESLQAVADELGVGDAVAFLGTRTDIPDVLAAADIAVSSSDFEGSPLSVMEYMAAGLPVVATDVGGVPKLVRPGETGLLVPPRDPAALATAVLELLRDPALARELGRRGREVQSAHFSFEAMLARIEEIYDEQLALKRRRAR